MPIRIMKKVLFIFLVLYFAKSNAQHCGWDGIDIIIIEVTDGANKKIDGLKLTLVDSMNCEYISNSQSTNKERWLNYHPGDTLIFQQSKLTDYKRSDLNRHLMAAKDNYFIIVYGNNFKREAKVKANAIFDKIKIEDKTGTFATRYVPLKITDLHPLCDDYPIEKYFSDDKILHYTLQPD